MAKYKRAFFKSGFSVSIQASETNYSSPRDNIGPYTSVELGFPSAPEPLIAGYADDPEDPTGTVYGWVPVGLVKAMAIKHNGLVEGTVPPFDMSVEQSTILAEALQGKVFSSDD